MTKEQKEEFLQYLENLKLIQADDFYREGLDMAISALKEPTWQEKFEKEYLFESIKEDMAKLQAENERLLKEVEALKGGWIPVEERNPDEERTYVVTVNHGNGEYVTTAIFNYLYEKGWSDSQVIAWREDIEPYKKGE